MSLPISVALPLGPQKEYLQWLPECLDSIVANDPNEIIIIDDMSSIDESWFSSRGYKVRYYRNEWLLGGSDSWNRAVALASNDLVFLTGSDDKLLPYCLEECVNSYEVHNKMAGYYSVTIQYENGDLQDLPCNAAAVSRRLWQEVGGFPPCGFAAPDSLLLSVLMTYFGNRIVNVAKGRPLYFVRKHDFQDTPRQFGRFFGPASQIRDIYTREWPNIDIEWAGRVR